MLYRPAIVNNDDDRDTVSSDDIIQLCDTKNAQLMHDYENEEAKWNEEEIERDTMIATTEHQQSKIRKRGE